MTLEKLIRAMEELGVEDAEDQAKLMYFASPNEYLHNSGFLEDLRRCGVVVVPRLPIPVERGF